MLMNRNWSKKNQIKISKYIPFVKKLKITKTSMKNVYKLGNTREGRMWLHERWILLPSIPNRIRRYQFQNLKLMLFIYKECIISKVNFLGCVDFVERFVSSTQILQRFCSLEQKFFHFQNFLICCRWVLSKFHGHWKYMFHTTKPEPNYIIF